jgi:phosphoribosylaminoimidazole-succinocarboxamide synthase
MTNNKRPMTPTSTALLQSDLTGIPVRRGKVRDVYDLGDKLLLVATDRISAFDWVMPTGIPDKGRILTQLSAYWFHLLGVPNHVISTDPGALTLSAAYDREQLVGRSTIVRKCRVVPVECVVRGYLEGSGWKEYRASGGVCGISLPPGLVQCSKLPEPIFTPATKEESGHDQNISFDQMAAIVGHPTAEELRRRSVEIYKRAAEHAQARGIVIADTKFEFGWLEDSSAGPHNLILIDEVLTPDSSRFWPADQYQAGRAQPSFDKQYLREWLETTGWDKNSPPPSLPDEIVARTREKYVEAFERLTGEKFCRGAGLT